MKTRFIDPLNTFLILCAAVLAYIFPFWIFVIAYVVLGPLHYLTEINWLNDRNFFFEKRPRWIWLLSAAALITAIVLARQYQPFLFPGLNEISSSNLILASFLSAIVLLYIEKEKWAYLLCSIFFILAIVLPTLPALFYLIAAFLPTVLHVYFFTGFFMLQGAHKGNSKIGYLNVFLMFSVGIILLAIPPLSTDVFNEATSSFMLHSRFDNLNRRIGQLIPNSEHSYLQIQSFLAFIYSYHYLNWFSKTGIIKWHKSRKWKLAASLITWFAAISLYTINFKAGLSVLFGLSLLHVFLEFPLNIQSIGYIFKRIIFNRPHSK